MKLTDEEIKIFAKKTFPKYFEKGHTRTVFTDGMKVARDFYENQTCMNCDKDMEISRCLIYIAMSEEHKLNENENLDTDKCKCSLWEPCK